MLHSNLAYYFQKSEDAGLAEAEGAVDVVRVPYAEPQSLHVRNYYNVL